MSQPAKTDPGLEGAASRMAESFGGLEQAHEAIQQLANVRVSRAWSANEYDRYLVLLQSQRLAVRRYLAAHRAFDALRHRTLRRGEPSVGGSSSAS